MKCNWAYRICEYNGWGCKLTDGPCKFVAPDSKACAEKFKEGPDAVNRKAKISLGIKNVDWLYKEMIGMLKEISDLSESDIIERKDKWTEYEEWDKKLYIIECELSDNEYTYLCKNFKVEEI